jgi:hypothetical protein
MEISRRLARWLTAVSGWPIWSLPRWLSVFVLTVIAVDGAAIGIAASVTTVTGHDLILFTLLLACTAFAVELSRKAGEQGGMIKDVQGVWELPVAILLPPLYALIAPSGGYGARPLIGGCSAAPHSGFPTAQRR